MTGTSMSLILTICPTNILTKNDFRWISITTVYTGFPTLLEIGLLWGKYLPQNYYLFALCFLCIKFWSDGVEQIALYIDANTPT